MKQRETYAVFNFNLLWTMQRGYPSFQDLSGYVPQQPVDVSDLAGEGTEAEPYIITTADELAAMAQDLEAHYVLGNDIDMRDTLVWDHGLGWTPIGSFQGSLDGQGHVLSNLTINNPILSATGLFGGGTTAALRNIRMQDVHVRGGVNVGALAGTLAGGAIEHCSFTGVVLGVGSVGGVAGNMTGDVHDVSADVDVYSSGEHTGGLVGYFEGSIRHSHTSGTVNGNNFVGGLVGRFTGSIADSYSHAAVSGDGDHIGGLAGYAGLRTTLWNIPGAIHRSFSTGRVTGTGETVGGLLGGIYVGSVHLSFWDTQTSGQDSSAGGVGLNTSAMKQQETYRFFNFYNLWRIEQGKEYPAFQNLTGYAQPRAVTLADLAGQGTEDDPYIITTVDELAAMAQDLEAHYRLGNNIEMRDTLVWDYGRGWTPISDFKGSLDGAGRVISHVTVNRVGDSAGLFKSLNNAEVRDLHLRDVNIYDSSSVGALAATISNTEEKHVVNCSATGQVVAFQWSGGGLFGAASGAGLVIRDSYAVVDVHGGERMAVELGRGGGLIGHLSREAKLKRSFAAGSVEGSWYVGGLVGRLDYNARIENSYSRASVSGKSFVGGLVGQVGGRGQWGFHDGFVWWTYSTGLVSGDDDEATTVGGLVGHLVTDTPTKKVQGSYWDTETSGQETSRGEVVVGLTTAEMRDADFGWDFTDVWRKDADPWRNDGYPWLHGVTREAVTIQVQADPDERGQVSGAGTFLYGTRVAVQAAAEEGYAFINWTQGGQVVSTSPSYTFSATANRTLVAHFGEASGSLQVVIDPEAVRNQARWRRAGGAWRTSGHTETNVPSGEHVVAFNIVPGWNTLGDRNVEISVNETTTLNVAYTQNNAEYPIGASVDGPGGSVTGGDNYLHNSLVQLTATPDQGYRFLYWMDEQGRIYTDRTIEFRATEGRTFTAYFEELKAALPGVLMLLLDEK